MKECRHCGSEISNKAKICPVCKKSQEGIIAKFFKLFAIAVILLILLGVGISNIAKEKDEEQENFDHDITNEYTDSIGTHYIEGTLKNNNNKEYSYLQIEFVCYDADGNNLGTALDNTNNLGSNETWKFKAMLLSTSGEATKCEFKEVTGW